MDKTTVIHQGAFVTRVTAENHVTLSAPLMGSVSTEVVFVMRRRVSKEICVKTQAAQAGLLIAMVTEVAT